MSSSQPLTADVGAQTDAPTPWTERELTAALRAAGWRRIAGPARAYRSPDGVVFHLDQYDAETGVQWRRYAARRELPMGGV